MDIAQNQLISFLNDAERHRSWLERELAGLPRSTADSETTGRAIHGAIEELDRLICLATRLPSKQQNQTLRGGRESDGRIGNKDAGPYQPKCLLAHDLINKLSVIIGRCELLQEEIPKDSSVSTQLSLVREVATAMAVDLKQRLGGGAASNADLLDPCSARARSECGSCRS